ncbi:MAG: hypothetical protein SGARI_001011, partial [Bacillariaceae sp.]
HSLRAAPPIKRPEKKPSLLSTTKEDLRPTPLHESGNASDGALPFSPHSLRSIPRSETIDADEKSAAEEDVGALVAATLSKLDKSPKKKDKKSRPRPDKSPSKHSRMKEAAVKDTVGAIARESALSNKPRPIGAEETMRKPTRSGYDNWGLVKKGFLPTIQLDQGDDASTISHSMDGDTVSEASKSGASDWGVPTQYQNEDDSSWVNPARPVDPRRKQKVKAEVDRMFVKHLEETRLRSLADMPLYENKQETDAFAAEEDDGESRPLELTPDMMTRPGSFDEEKGWSMPSDTTTLDKARRRPPCDPPSVEESGWSMPSKATAVVYHKAEVEQKDYRYTYITARSAIVDTSDNDVPPVSSYWDKIRNNYFDNGRVPFPTDGAAKTNNAGVINYRPSLQSTVFVGASDDDQTVSSEWLPPDYSTNSTYRTIAAQFRARTDSDAPAASYTAQSRGAGAATSYMIDPPSVTGAPDAASRSADSDWVPPSNTKMSRRIDFAGRVTYQNDSDGSDTIPWVPRPEDLVFETSAEEEQGSGNIENQDSESSDGYSSDYANGTVYSSALKFGDESMHLEDRDDFVQNPDMNASGVSFFADDDEADAVQAVRRQLRTIEEGRPGAQRQPSGILKGSKSSSQSSSASIDASLDSVLSYTGRISFAIQPDVITFEDGPNEDRGIHYNNFGRGSKSKDEKYRRRGSGPDPCVYYSLCCIFVFVFVPAVVLTILFVFVIDLNGDS